jgi:hypothetical protein
VRSWQTDFRGDLLVCAGRQIDPDGALRLRMGASELEPTGAALCVVELADVRPLERRDHKASCAAYRFSPLDPAMVTRSGASGAASTTNSANKTRLISSCPSALVAWLGAGDRPRRSARAP